MNKHIQVAFAAVAMCFAAVSTASDQQLVKAEPSLSPEPSLSMVVMDPLAAPLSCPCVEGYAQRDYTVLQKLLEAELGVEIKLAFAGSLQAGIDKVGSADIIVGKHSVVTHDLKLAKLNSQPAYRLTDSKGQTVQHGLIVVNRDDPAQVAKDLSGYTIIFGDSSALEKHEAALNLLKKAGVSVPEDLRKIDAACSDGACKVVDLGPTSRTAAVISSYAQPLLEGCGTIKQGDLRVVARTADVPFVTLFLSDKLSDERRKQIDTALQLIPARPSLLESLESLAGFLKVEVADEPARTKAIKKKTSQEISTQ